MTTLEKQSKSASSSRLKQRRSRPDAPEVRHPYVFSVSQVETFLVCPRKWAFQKIDGIEEPPNKFAELGQRVHGVLEEYLERGKPITSDTVEGNIALSGIRYLPYPRTPGMRIEKWFAIVFGVAAYRGLKDVELILRDSIPLVLDHKTTRSWDWKKTERELLRDVQAGIYAADAMRKTGAQEVALRWLYYRTEGAPLAEPVDVTINRRQVSDILSFTDHTAKRMIHVLQTCTKAMDVVPDYTGCSAYGGCPHRDKSCKPKPVKVLKAIMAQKKKAQDRRKNKEKSTDDFLQFLETRRSKSSDSSKRKRQPDVIDIDDVEEADVVNSKDREEAERPGPPPAKKVGNEWVFPIWNEEEWTWEWPEGTEEKEKVEMAKKKKKSKSSSKSSSRRSAADIIAGVGKKDKKNDKKKKSRKEEEEEEPEEDEEEEQEEEEEDGEDEEDEEDEEEEEPEEDLLDRFIDLLADRIADRIAARKKK